MHCNKCGHDWDPRVKDPKTCPRCKRYLNAPIREKKDAGEVVELGHEQAATTG